MAISTLSLRTRALLAMGAQLVLASSVRAQNPATAQTVCEAPLSSDVSADYDRACPANTSGPECDRWWHLRQTGVLAARELLAAKVGKEVCAAGAGVVVGQMDTGVIDRHTFTPDASQPLDMTSVHPLMQRSLAGPFRIVTTTAAGALLPLSYSPGLPKATACEANVRIYQGETCAARDPEAEGVPRDSLSAFSIIPGTRQQGHGTGTMHVLLQAAPGVSVVPYKFASGIIATNGRATQLSSAIIAAAMEDRIAGATGGRVDVITMSLGRRSPSDMLEQALATAETEGIILVGAAGQWPLHGTRTRFPAAYPSVIGVTGTTIDLEPWEALFKAGHGRHNLVAAPAAGIWRAGWKKDGKTGRPVYRAGKGTSFAAPVVAATAAMWVELHGRAQLDARYGRAAVPSAFRWVLEHHGTRTPAAVCTDLLTPLPGDPWKARCDGASDDWDTNNWGKGILAADLALKAALPTRAVVCAYVLERRGNDAHARLCPEPLDSTTAVPDAERLTMPPKVSAPSRWTYVAGATLAGRLTDRTRLFSPALSVALIRSGNEVDAPKGWMLQTTFARGMQEVSLGWAGIVDYSAYGPNRKLDVIPAFGPTLGVAVTATGIREDLPEGQHWWFGPKAQLTYYRVRLQTAWVFGRVDREVTNRWLWNVGVGF